MNLKDQAATGVRWTMLGTVGSQALNFGVLALLARELGPKAFGIVALASIWIKFLQYFLSQGLGMAIIQRKDLSDEHLSSAFWHTMAMGALLAAITASLAGVVAEFFSEPNLEPVLQVLSLSFVISGLSAVQTALMTRERQFKKLASRSLAGSLVASGVAVALAFAGAGVWTLVAKQLVLSSVMALVLWSTSKWRPSLRFSLDHLKELWGFSMKVFARNLVGFFYLEADKFLIGRLIGAGELGYYSNSKQLARMIVNIARKPVETVAMPILSKLQDDKSKMADTICKSQNMMATLLVPIFCGIAALAPEVVEILFGPQWALAREPLRYLSFAEAVNACSAVAFTAIMAVGRPGLSLLHLSICAVTAIAGTLIGAQWGIVGVALASLINAFIYSGVFVVILCRATDVNPLRYLGANLPALAASAAMVAVAIGTTSALGETSNTYLRASAGAIGGALTYLSVIRLISLDSFETAKSIGYKALGLRGTKVRPS